MINITTSFPNKTAAAFHKHVTGSEVASAMFPEIAGSIVALFVDGNLQDLATPISKDGSVDPVTIESNTGMDIIRHDAAHIMARAVREIFPDTKLAIGPTIENGFYYDFDLSHSLSEKDFEAIERKMSDIIAKDERFVREVWPRERAIKFFEDLGEHYKLEILSKVPLGEEITVYKHGEFVDLCRGPHAPSARYVKAFKLTKISGAYWLGDQKNKMLQRVYGTAWHSSEALASYIHNMQEAEKRDHRKIAKDLGWFHIQNEALGQVFWHDKGWVIYRIIEEYIRCKLKKHGYLEVKTPIMLDRKLWEKSGHWEKFKENMFVVEDDKKELAIKPMNCPCHVQIFKSKIRSYKELPIRMAEFGMCHRNEPSGSLYGLMRVRGFTQDDAHIFCTHEQVRDEVLRFYELLMEVYKDFGFDSVTVKLSDRPENRIGSDEIWDRSEQSLMEPMNALGVQYTINKGEGAFYGPKLEFTLKDSIGREWQCGTVQLDFVLPDRLGAYYIGEDGKKHIPVIIHRAVLGTIERFIGILIEHYAGNIPAWLAPVQLEILTVSGEVAEYARDLAEMASQENVRVELNAAEENISHKIRKAIFNKVPIVWVVGKSEAGDRCVSVRRYGSGETCRMAAGKALKTLLTCVSMR
ncbi:threonine--tRNA ligase [Anaplasma marginale]|uniref:Threonine--tRNA ligase n=1 Tax=Anaplasma marginale (strain Florida) TaxID=320483 RepID=SYT_ANAMF|nr:threonine--tRNA ligase [Anaplasma marginale]B9KH76.1 RecName: Full=Threonine--tRNA ligase; AltName: Full=Threonyl-tRNA synthetase; Short=ThrRS [Anaplasma marginale str. Florida]ACM49780.1 Threonyl-tRNA synthetase (thrS) [Anaplasma marginale str. Florida]